jgi:hypothetical protein
MAPIVDGFERTLDAVSLPPEIRSTRTGLSGTRNSLTFTPGPRSAPQRGTVSSSVLDKSQCISGP